MPTATSTSDRRGRLIADLQRVIEDVSGVEIPEPDVSTTFLDLGLDSLSLTQVALQLGRAFKIKVTFRQLMETYPSVERLAEYMDETLPSDAPVAPSPAPLPAGASAVGSPHAGVGPGGDGRSRRAGAARVGPELVHSKRRRSAARAHGAAAGVARRAATSVGVPAGVAGGGAGGGRPRPQRRRRRPKSRRPAPADEEGSAGMIKYDVKKAFGAIARIHTASARAVARNSARASTPSCAATSRAPRSPRSTPPRHRPHLADPRVVNGFRPLIKEIVYQIVVERSRGRAPLGSRRQRVRRRPQRLRHEPVRLAAGVRRSRRSSSQLDLGYEIGPQHPLAGEVAQARLRAHRLRSRGALQHRLGGGHGRRCASRAP